MSNAAPASLPPLPRGPLEPDQVSYAVLVSTLADCAREATDDTAELSTAQLAAVLRQHPQLMGKIATADLAGDVVEDLTEHGTFFRAAPLVGASVLGRLSYHAQQQLREDVRVELARRAGARR